MDLNGFNQIWSGLCCGFFMASFPVCPCFVWDRFNVGTNPWSGSDLTKLHIRKQQTAKCKLQTINQKRRPTDTQYHIVHTPVESTTLSTLSAHRTIVAHAANTASRLIVPHCPRPHRAHLSTPQTHSIAHNPQNTRSRHIPQLCSNFWNRFNLAQTHVQILILIRLRFGFVLYQSVTNQRSRYRKSLVLSICFRLILAEVDQAAMATDMAVWLTRARRWLTQFQS